MSGGPMESQKTCSTCEHARNMLMAGGGLVCHGGPPTALIAAGPLGQQVVVAAWPPVPAGESCGAWREKAPQVALPAGGNSAQNTGGKPNGNP